MINLYGFFRGFVRGQQKFKADFDDFVKVVKVKIEEFCEGVGYLFTVVLSY
jgi:hypothetical protein